MTTTFDFNKFRLRTFMNHLAEIGELETFDKPLALTDITAKIENSPKAVVAAIHGTVKPQGR